MDGSLVQKLGSINSQDLTNFLPCFRDIFSRYYIFR